MSRLFIALYRDEDVAVLSAQLLRARGFVVITTQEAGQLHNSDAEQLAYAVSQRKTLLTHNRVEDTYIPTQDKRWVVVAPPGASESRLLLARAMGEEQASRVGNQTGGRVFRFLYTDDFRRDFHAYKTKGVVFVREPQEERYGTVTVFQDLYGNRWDLLQLKR